MIAFDVLYLGEVDRVDAGRRKACRHATAHEGLHCRRHVSPSLLLLLYTREAARERRKRARVFDMRREGRGGEGEEGVGDAPWNT